MSKKIDKLLKEADEKKLNTAVLIENTEGWVKQKYPSYGKGPTKLSPKDAHKLVEKWCEILEYPSYEERVKNLFKEGKISEREAFEELL